MALLTAEEREKLSKEGIWVREKCDSCHKPILSPLSYIKKGKTLCASCAKGQDLVLVNTKEENEMAKQKAEKKAAPKKETSKVGGYLIAGTALADLYELLSDQKKHSLADAKKIATKHKKDLPGRLGNLRRVGQKKKAWSLIVDETHVQMKLGIPPKEAPKKEKEPPAKKKSSEPEEKAPVTSKAMKAMQNLIRRSLKTKKDQTRNKLIEYLKEEHDADPKRVEEALKIEIKAGGITVVDGILTLA